MRFSCFVFLAVLAGCSAKDCSNSKKSNSKLFCYYSKVTDIDGCYCSHVILPANSDVKSVERVRQHSKGVKILVTVNEFNQGLIDLLKTTKVDGLEINLKKLDAKNDISDFISTVRSKLGSDLYLALSVPTKAEILTKYYDFKALSKYADVFVLQTAFLGASKNVTFHPSRLSGLWDMQNTDSIVDLISGLGAPLSKLVITAPVQAFDFTLQNEEFSAPGSPALELKSLTRNELCDQMKSGTNWTLERDQDQAGPYIFYKNKWIAFEDASSIDIKAKYSRVRGLAGLALKDLSQDGGEKCGSAILESAYNGLSRQARAPRGAVLHSLEREILETPVKQLDSVHVSPYRISRIIDVEGHIHVVRQDTRTEFTCSRQGYFVHPRSCNRFYRCVKFDQLTDDFNVFEFDCPAGLAFDERVEVCVWPGSLPEGQPCAGSSEIAPVPRERFLCPHEPGYYADPENCRWFFACLDHGKSALTAYEFRCPFGLVFDSDRLLCEWSWLVPKCGSGSGLGINLASEFYYGGSSSNTGYHSGLALGQYDGLGTLGVVKLGGVSGKIQQPIVYSNVGVANYQHFGLGGLGNKATQTLYNAGLLKGNLPTGYSHNSAGDSNIYNDNNKYAIGIGLNGGQYNSGANTQYTSGSYSDSGKGDSNLNGNGIFGLSTIASGQDTFNLNAQYNNGLLKSNVVTANNQNSATGSNIYSNSKEYAAGTLSHGSGATFVDANANNQYNSNAYRTDNANAQYASGVYLAGGQANSDFNENGVFGLKTVASGSDNDGSLKSNIVSVYNQNLGSGSYINTNNNGYATGTGLHGSDGGSVGVIANNQYNSNAYGIENANAQYASGVYLAEGKTASDFNGNGHFGLKTTVSGADASNLNNYASAGIQNTVIHGTNAAPVTFGIGVGTETLYQENSPHSFVHHYQHNEGSGVAGNEGAINNIGFNNEVTKNLNLESNIAYQSGNDNAYDKQYTGTGLNYQGETLGNINIVGGGYSAVGQSNYGVEVNSNGENHIGITHSTTPTPIAVTTYSSVPTVTSVPVPTLKTASGFENYQGGVIANIPELQYKVKNNNGLVNVSTSFVNFISTTSAVAVDGSYGYEKSSVPVVSGHTFIPSQDNSQYSHGGATSYTHNSQNYGSDGGYVYSKPSVSFEDGQVNAVQQENVYTHLVSTPKPFAVLEQHNIIQPTVSVQDGGGYVYSKPSVAFEETPIKTINQVVVPDYKYSTPSPIKHTFIQENVQPVVRVQPTISTYSYPTANIAKVNLVEEKVQSPVIPLQSVTSQPATSYSFTRHDSVGYKDQKASVLYENKPVVVQQPQIYVSSTVAPIVEDNSKAKPISSYSYTQDFGSQGYYYSKPTTPLVEHPVQHVQPNIISRFSIRKPTVQQTYNYQQENNFAGYDYEKPSVEFKEQPVYDIQKPAIQQVVVQSTPAPVIFNYHQPIQQTKYLQPAVKPAIISSYHYQQPSVSSYTFKDVVQKGIKKPITYLPVTEAPIIRQQPTVVSTYDYTPSTTPNSVVVNYENTYSSTSKPAVLLQRAPAVVSSYSYVAPATNKPEIILEKQPSVEFNGYDYPKPVVTFAEEPKNIVTTYENKQPVQEIPFVKKTAYITGQVNNQNANEYNYFNPTPASPVVVENYQAPIYSNNFIQSTPKPTFYSTISSVITKSHPATEAPNFYFYDSRLSTTPKALLQKGYSYPKPNIVFEEKPIVSSTYLPTPTREYLPVESVTTSRPVAKYSFSSLDQQYQYVSTPSPNIISSTTPLSGEYLPVKTRTRFRVTTPVPTYIVPEISTPSKSYLPVTTSRPIAKYSFSSLDEQYQYVSTPSPSVLSSTSPISGEYLPVKTRTRFRVTTPAPTYVVPEISTPSVSYLPVRTKVRYTTAPPIDVSYPSEEYLPVKVPVEVTTLSRDYLPVKSRVRVTTTGIPYEQQEVEVSSRKPPRIVKVIRPAAKTIIKQNDFLPILSAKLGAQCTCASNTLKLRKNQKVIIVEDDDNDDDGYVVENDNQDGVVVENYQYEPQKVVEITPASEVYIKETSSDVVSSTPSYAVKKRVRVRPTSTLAYDYVTKPIDLFVKKEVTPAPSDREIADAVRTGLKLVKQAAKEGAKEGAEEVIGEYNSRVRETIECQRAGLFRHPNQCNKFYACRWDCTKNKYTLHTFNCPVHLTFDNSLGACNWPSQGPACTENTLLPTE